MPLNPEARAAYMREYRKRHRREAIMNTTMPAQAVRELVEAQDRIRELEAEVARLKKELSGYHWYEVTDAEMAEAIKRQNPSFGHANPAPKPGHR